MKLHFIRTGLILWVFTILGIAVLPNAVAAQGSQPETVARLIREGLSRNQEIQSLVLRVQALKAEIGFAGALDDPRVGIGLANLPTDTFSFSQEPMTQKQLFIAQKFPWFGKLDLRSKRVAAMALRQAAVLNAKQLSLARRIADTYYDFGFIMRRRETNRRLTEMVTQLLRVSETRYASGKGMQSDVLQAQVELSKLLDERIMLRGIQRTSEDRLNELIDRDAFEPIPAPGELLRPVVDLDVEALRGRAVSHNPEILIKQAEIDLAGIERDLARKDYWPDMDVKLGYGQREEDRTGRDLPDFVSASVTVNIPLWQKYRQDNKLLAKKRQHQAAVRSYQNLVNGLPHRVDALVNDIRATLENYDVFKQVLLIQSRQWAESTLSVYQVGKIEFNTVMNAHIRQARLELQAEQYLFDIYRKQAALEELIGSGPPDADAAGQS